MEEENFLSTKNLFKDPINDAKEAYEAIRENILKELEIQYIQTNIQNKIMGVKSKEIELLFYKKNVDSEETEDMLSESVNDYNIADESIEYISRESEIEDNTLVYPFSENEVEKKKRKNNAANKFLHLEAECSSIEDSEEEFEDRDLEDIIDYDCLDNVEEAATMFYANKIKEDAKNIKDLKNRFSNDSRIKRVKRDFERNYFEDSDYELSEIEELIIEDNEDKEDEELTNCEEYITVAEKKPQKLENEDFFNINSELLDKFSKKNEKKSFGFKEA